MKNKQLLSKFLFPLFYSAAIFIMVLYQWNQQHNIREGGESPIYFNLTSGTAYARHGFDPSFIRDLPQNIDSGEWVRFQSAPFRIMNTSLPNLPERTFLSPKAHQDEEFTIIIPVEIESDALALFNSDTSALPGIFLSCIGENWEIFLNGNLIRSEMHLDENGQIRERRTWRDVYFPIDKTFLAAGTNILAFRIIGDPSYEGTGLYYTTPYYIDDYRVIDRRQHNFLLFILCGIFGFTGLYYLMIFFSTRQRSEVFNLYYGIFSFLLCIYSFVRIGSINILIPNSDISVRLEFVTLFMVVPFIGIFIESLGRKIVTKITWGITFFCALISVLQIFFCAQFGQEMLYIWNIVIIIYFTYVFIYDIIYFYFWEQRRKRKLDDDAARASNRSIENVLIGSMLVYFCGIYDILDVLFFHNSFTFFLYSCFVFHIGIAFSLSQRFSGMYKQLENSNETLELAVHQRTLELEEQTKIAIQASQAKSRFLATMSHEIRTPLNAVIGLSEIELKGNLPEKSKNNISQIHQSGSTLLGIINDILDISKIEAGGFDIIPVEYETASLIRDTINLNRVRIGSNPIIFELEIEETFPRKLFGDELRIKQILNNVLSNAIKYTNEGKVTFSVQWNVINELSESHSDRLAKEALIRFIVRDTGIGMRKEDMKKLFTDYTQLDIESHRNIEGTGLGLSITKKLVEMMGGKITADSEYGKGSVFTIEIVQPIIDENPIGTEAAQNLKDFKYKDTNSENNNVQYWMPDAKVLIVDDIPVNLQVAKGLLEPYGLKVDTAVSGYESIGKIKTSADYDLILMDHMMPEMDGTEAVRIIRNEIDCEYCKNVPVIALTANAIIGVKDMFIEKGFNDFLAKPVDITKLDEALRRWIPAEKIVQKIVSNDQEKNNDKVLFEIPGVDISQGIAQTGGKKENYLLVLSMFCKDAKDRLQILSQKQDVDTLPLFTTHIHALKSAMASLGAAELSAEAAALEEAGNAEDLAFISEKLPVFVNQLTELVNNIEAALNKNDYTLSDNAPSHNTLFQMQTPLLKELSLVLESQNVIEIDRIWEELNKNPVDSQTKNALNEINEYILAADYLKAKELVDKLT